MGDSITHEIEHLTGRRAAHGRVQRLLTQGRTFGLIEREYARSVKLLFEVTQRSAWFAHQPVLAPSIRLRNPSVDPLSHLL